MVRVEVNTNISQPVHDVFEFVRQESNLPKWDEELIKIIKTSDGDFGMGTKLHLDIKPIMGVTEGTGEVVGYEPDKKIEFQFEMGKVKPHVWHLTEPQGAGTKFTRVVEIQPKGFMKLMTPMMARKIYKYNVDILAKLKSLLEA